jgi:site-specific recombinase XerD
MDKRDYASFFSHTSSVLSRGNDDHYYSALGRDESRAGPSSPSEPSDSAAAIPNWFADFLIERATRKPSEHTMAAYRQDFASVAAFLTGSSPADIALADITKDNMRAAFAAYACTHEPASIRRCWSTWNVLCDFLYTAELILANPMPFVGRPKPAKTLPRSLPRPAVDALLDAVDAPHGSPRRTDWAERDLALILTGLLAGLRLDELRRADVGDIRTSTGDGAVIYVRGKGGKDRTVPIEADLLAVIENYLDSRAAHFPNATRSSARQGLSRWASNVPLFVGHDGERISRGTIQSRVRRAFRRAGPDAQPIRGALVHGLRHTYATELANSNVSVYTLMKLLGHESMATSQRYVAGAARETRTAAAQNPLYGVIRDRLHQPEKPDGDSHR